MLPIKVSGTFKGKNCDELHAFESTHGRIIGGMNTKVKKALEEVYAQGINPEVVEVEVKMNPAKMEVAWSVIIDKSTDGKAWVGFTSRGASGSDAFTRAISRSVKQDPASLLQNVKTSFNEPNAELKKALDFTHALNAEGKPTGKCPTRQVFYSYTKPNKFPSLP